MKKFSDTVTTSAQGQLVILSAATVNVYLTGTVTPATIYSTNAGAAKANPFQSSATGLIEFYAADGRYDLLVSKTGYDTVTVSDILLEDPDDEVDDGINNAAITLSTINSSTVGLTTPTLAKFTGVLLDTAAPAAATVGQLRWNDTDGTAEVRLKGGNVDLQIGQEQVSLVYNNTGSAFLEMQVVRITGAQGTRLTAALAQADSEANAGKTFAMVTEPIANNSEGYATTHGLVRNIDTSAYAEGAALWLSPSVAGGLTDVRPQTPNFPVLVGWVVRSHPTLGSIHVKVHNDSMPLSVAYDSEVQTATAAQTVFNLTTTTYTPGANTLSVHVNGLLMTLGTDYTETDGDTVTFTSGLTVGDEVVFVTGRTLNGAIGAETVSYLPQGTGAVATTVQAKLRESVSVKDFRAVGDGVTDDTAAIQAAVDFSRGNNNETIIFPAGRYLIADTINIGPGTKIQGSNGDYGGVAGATSYPLQLSDSKGTVLIFAPTTQKSLFVPALPKGGSTAWSAISIKGLNIWGNTSLDDYHKALFGDVSPVVENSLYAIDFKEVQFSTVENVAITGFMAGVREGSRCQSNVFSKMYIARSRRASILYTDNDLVAEATDSVWRDSTFWLTKHFVEAEDTGATTYSGDSLQLRFDSCVFKGSASHGFLMPRKAKDWTFVDCFGETIALDTSIAARACFYVGFSAGGSGSNYNGVNLTVIGGQWAGAAAPGGTFLSADYCGGVNLIGPAVKRFAVGILATANTRDKSIYMSNPLFNTVTTLFSGTTSKLHGIYRTVDMTGGSDVVQLKMDYLVADGDIQVVPGTGNNIKLGDGSTTGDVRPGNAAVDFGDSTIRWRYLYAANLTTDADYLLWGKTAYTSLSTDGAWMNRLGFVGASYTSSPAGYFNRNGTDGGLMNFYKAGTGVGSISVTGSATAYNTSSDYRLKENVVPLTGSGAFIDALQPCKWNWKTDGTQGAGFIAHQLQAVSPASVVGEKDAVDEDGNPVYQAVEYGSAEVIANLIAEVQDLRRRLANAGVA